MKSMKESNTANGQQDLEKKSPTHGHLFRDERGMSTIEYVILLVVIVVGAVGLWNKIGGKVISDLESAERAVQEVAPGGK